MPNTNISSLIYTSNSNSVSTNVACFLMASATANQSISGTNNLIKFTAVDNQIGTRITLDATGSILLKAGSTYRIIGHLGYINGSSAVGFSFQWRTGNVAGSGTFIGKSLQFDADGATGNSVPSSPIAEVVYSPTVDTYIHLENITSSITSVGNGTLFPYCVVQELSSQATVMNTVDYGYFYRTSNQTTSVSVGSPIIFTNSNGNMTVDTTTGKITLRAGKTYKITGSLGGINASATCSAQWRDITNNVYLGNVSIRLPATAGSTWASEWAPCTAIVAPSSDIQIQLWIIQASGITAIGASEYGYNSFSWAMVEQIGTTAVSTIPSNLIDAPWQSYTPAFTASVTNPTLATTNILRGIYRIVGKTLEYRIMYQHSNKTGAVNGSGAYYFSLPSTYTYDATLLGGALDSTNLPTADYLTSLSIGQVKILSRASGAVVDIYIGSPYLATGNKIAIMGQARSWLGSGWGGVANDFINFTIEGSIPIV